MENISSSDRTSSCASHSVSVFPQTLPDTKQNANMNTFLWRSGSHQSASNLVDNGTIDSSELPRRLGEMNLTNDEETQCSQCQ
ncbi:hypothetical protein XU18_0531 [Perkinsela sp. CCAP 1560/4]|nr:hypothetical protein XU18_0531 [Perkinsela sp. CCAP 1560/4]|eukprot:KNH09253.1 hypothetical protein XU18_0531 [Perkinsela sp. CCAP 1560/4]